MSSLSAIFFDLDGTLVDSSIGIHNGFTYTFEQLGVPSPDAKPSVVLWDHHWKLVSLVAYQLSRLS